MGTINGDFTIFERHECANIEQDVGDTDWWRSVDCIKVCHIVSATLVYDEHHPYQDLDYRVRDCRLNWD